MPTARPAAWITLVLCGGCASLTPGPQAPAPDHPLLDSLAGHYSNFGQAGMEGAPNGVVDLRISELGAGAARAWLVERKYRESGEVQQRLYQLSSDLQGTYQLHVKILSPGQAGAASVQPTEVMREKDEDCAITLTAGSEELSGFVHPNNCRFEHPLLGDLGLFRQVTIKDSYIEIAEFLVDAGGQSLGDTRSQEFDRHQIYQARASILLPEPDGEPGAWRHSALLNISDDGRMTPLLEDAETPMGFSLQLAVIEWRSGEPDFLRLQVVQDRNGVINAMKWVPPGSGAIEFESDWLSLWVGPPGAQPSE